MHLKPAYPLAEFADMLGWSHGKVKMLASRGSLPTERIGGKRYVTLVAICERFPGLWESIQRVAALRAMVTDGND